MVYLHSDDLDKFEKGHTGTFGTFYKVDDNTAYKIYLDKIKTQKRIIVDNPNLSVIGPHYKLLKRRAKNIKYTDLLHDLVYLNGSFKGVKIVPYNGLRFIDKKDDDIDYKIELSKEYIRNVKELMKNWIYPADLQASNVMVSNGEVKIIDLDDVRTHAFIYPSLLFRLFTIRSLSYSIKEFFKEYNRCPISRKALKLLGRRKPNFPISFKTIDKYLQDRSETHSYIFIDKNTVIENIIDLILLKDLRVVYVAQNWEEVNSGIIGNKKFDNALPIIEFFKEKGIQLYDIVLAEDIDKYPTFEKIDEAFREENKSLRKIF